MRDKIDYDVIIIGAGLAGLTAAFTLLEKAPSLNILVLESSDRIGGRLLSKPLLCKTGKYKSYNFAGDFITTSHVFLWELLEKLNIKPKVYIKSDGVHIVENKNGNIYKIKHDPFEICSLTIRLQLFRLFQKLEELYQNISFSDPFKYAYLDAVTLETFLMDWWFITEEGKDIFRSLVFESCGIETTQLSVLFYLAFLNSIGGLPFFKDEDKYFIEGGFDEICQKITKKLSRNIILLRDCVEEIEEYSDGIINLNDIIFSCSSIIIAVQPSQVKNIKFFPDFLSPKTTFDNILEGCLIKFVVTYKTAFWKLKGFSGKVLSCRKNPILSCCDVTIQERPALSGLIYCNDNQDFRESILKQLANYFGNEALEIVSYSEKIWLKTGSPMCCIGLNKMIDYSKVFLPGKRIYWASAEITDNYYGHMEGAVQSGFRAAIDVLYEIRPYAISVHDFLKIRSAVKPQFFCKGTKKAFFFRKRNLLLGSTLIIFTYLILRKCSKSIFLNKK